MATVEQFEFIRKEYFIHKKSIRTIAEEQNIHRRLVRQAIANAMPPIQNRAIKNKKLLTPEIINFIEQCLKDDNNAPKKQKHTAHRIYARLIEEFNFSGAEPTIRKYVGIKRKELHLSSKAFIPLAYTAGEEAEVDWYEAYVDFPTGRRKIYFFQMRACYSGKEFHMAFFTLNQQAFFEGHVKAFEYFGGVFKKLRYDNLTSAVKKVLQGRKRLETDGFILLKSHYLFESIFCLPGKEGSHEKGGVECAGGRFRRNHLTPVPVFADLKELNDYVLQCCKKDNKRTVIGKDKSIISLWEEESAKLLPLPKLEFNTIKTLTPIANNKGFISLEGNKYSVPIHCADRKVEAQLYSNHIEIYQNGKLIATHQRCIGKKQVVTKLDHYLDLLYKKPLALRNSLPLKQMREQNIWPKAFDNIWQALQERYGDNKGSKQFIEILLLCRIHSQEKVQLAINDALSAGCCDVCGVMMMLNHSKETETSVPLDEHDIKDLVKYNRELPNLKAYDELLTETIGGLH